MNLGNVGGVFVVLIIGLGIACVIAVFEYLWRSRQLNRARVVRSRISSLFLTRYILANFFPSSRACWGRTFNCLRTACPAPCPHRLRSAVLRPRTKTATFIWTLSHRRLRRLVALRLFRTSSRRRYQPVLRCNRTNTPAAAILRRVAVATTITAISSSEVLRCPR